MYEKIVKQISELNSSVKIVAVSKLQPVEKIQALIKKGQRIFAENYIQEALLKMDQFKANNLEWHLIGSLQKNKVKNAVGNFALIHSVDSVELAKKINSVASEKGLTQKILIQINLAEEKTKGGIAKESLASFINEAKEFSNLEISGLMTIPPLSENPEDSRPYFKALKKLQNQYALKELSMGTSSDYQVAIEEGATLVRLGTVIFGERQNKTHKT